jgi:AcrR family transcriptional regulator
MLGVTMSGLRERKKQQTRQLIADTARELFAERGFEAVTVTDIARAAEVSPQTVFNYFPTKEDLFYSRLEAIETGMVDAVRNREPGESVLAAFARFILDLQGPMDDTEQLRTVTRVITESPALLARERQVLDHYASALAAAIAEETGDDTVVPLVTAYALIGLHRSLIEHVRRRVADGASASEIARSVRAEAERGIALLERGLGGQDAVPDAHDGVEDRVA